MPRLTGKVLTDLATWMDPFGLLIGVAFPPFCIAPGLPAERILTPIFFASTLSAGLAVARVRQRARACVRARQADSAGP